MRAPSSRRERVLIYGRSGAGKSSTYISVALDNSIGGEDSIVYLGDSDHGFDAVADEPDLKGYIQPTDLDVNDFPAWLEWVKSVRAVVRPDDWVVVDMIDKAWLAAQTHYWYQMSNGDPLADVYLRNQQAMSSDGAEGEYMGGAHGANWGVINKYYGAFFQQVISMPCHVLCCTPAREVRQDTKPEIKEQYKIGWTPQGQKDLAHGFHTILFAAETPQGYIYTTIKERGPIGRPGRRLLKGENVEDFVATYLRPVAGWKL